MTTQALQLDGFTQRMSSVLGYFTILF